MDTPEHGQYKQNIVEQIGSNYIASEHSIANEYEMNERHQLEFHTKKRKKYNKFKTKNYVIFIFRDKSFFTRNFIDKKKLLELLP